MEGGAERLKKPPAKRKSGRPVVIIVTSSGIRAAEITRSLEEYREGCTIAKLFAKHFKIEEQAQFLKNMPVNIAVGNPNRLCKLLEAKGKIWRGF